MHSRRPLPRALRRFAAAVAVLLAVTGVAGAQDPFGGTNPLTGGGLDISTTAAIDMVTGGGDWDLHGSHYSLHDVDLFSGALLSDDVANPISAMHSIQHDLLEADLLMINHAEIARRAREAYEKERRKAGIAVGARSNPGTAQAHEVVPFRACGNPRNTTFKARPETIEAWDVMCRAAVADGLTPTIVSAWRDPQHQKRLYQDGIRKYGSAAAARKWVAFSDGTNCSSKHCGGIAIDVDRSGGMEAWMHRVVGCWSSSSGFVAGGGSCSGGAQPVKRVQLYGFVFPMAHEPWHIELGIPVGDSPATADCDPDRAMAIPAMIGAIWRCRLADAGITGDAANYIVAQAVVVAKCESGWNPSITIAGGKYVNRPNPQGVYMTAAGVFQFIRSTANSWVDGGYANVHDPVANIDAAARYWISGYQRTGSNRSAWTPWACAAVNDGYATSSVLPEFGGPPLPDWAFQY